jgi:hypothetical protein
MFGCQSGGGLIHNSRGRKNGRLLLPVWDSVDPASLALALAALVAMLRLGAPMIPTLAVSALAGAVYRLATT